jgi:hypothetical protein
MRRAISRGGLALTLAAAVLGLLQVDLDEAAGKKKKVRPWWGTFARSGPIFEPRPGYTWDVNYTLRVSKKKRTWSIDDAVARLNCWDGSTSEGTVTPTSEYFEFAIPPVSGKLFAPKGARVVGDDGSGPYGVVPIVSDIPGQTPTGRGFMINVGRRYLRFPVRGRWLVEWFLQWQCAGGAFIGGVRIIPTYASRQVG